MRGMLISVQSQLEHHDGQRWSLTVRLTDGTAILDADMEDELLHRLIGLSAIEVEAMKQLGRQKDEVGASFNVNISLLMSCWTGRWTIGWVAQ